MARSRRTEREGDRRGCQDGLQQQRVSKFTLAAQDCDHEDFIQLVAADYAVIHTSDFCAESLVRRGSPAKRRIVDRHRRKRRLGAIRDGGECSRVRAAHESGVVIENWLTTEAPPTALRVVEYPTHNIADVDCYSRPALLFNIIARTLQALRRHFLQLKLSEFGLDATPIRGTPHRQRALG